MPEEFFKKALHSQGVAGFGRKASFSKEFRSEFHSGGGSRGKFKPKSASSILQAIICRFFGFNSVILVTRDLQVKIPPKREGSVTRVVQA